MQGGVRVGITTGWEPGTVVPHWPLVYTPKPLVEAVERAGGIPILLPVVAKPHIRNETLNQIDALIAAGEVLSIKRNVLQGNPSKDLESQNPLRFANERDYLLGALSKGMPVLGICRGHQVLNMVCGGSLYLDDVHLRPENTGIIHHQGDRPPEEAVHEVAMGGLLRALTGRSETRVNSFHRQGVIEPPPGFTVVARSPDGLVEGVASETHDFVLGLQFHPEVLPEPFWLRIFKGLIAAGETYRRNRQV